MFSVRVAGLAAGFLCVAGFAWADTPAPVAASTAPAITPNATQIPAGTLIDIEITQPVSSRDNKRGERFTLRLAEPVMLGDKVILPAGVTGMGEVLHAAGSGLGGKPGELLLAARYLEYNGQQILLRGMRMGGSGKSALLGAAMVPGGFGIFVHGGEVIIPAGARANAKLAQDVPATLASSPEPTPLSTQPTPVSNP